MMIAFVLCTEKTGSFLTKFKICCAVKAFCSQQITTGDNKVITIMTPCVTIYAVECFHLKGLTSTLLIIWA